jgi:ubiquitin-conjugating enzyme E2 variant
LVCFGLAVLAVAWLCGSLTWEVWLVLILGVNANQIHKWAHRTRAENGPIIGFLQRIRLIQTPRHHAFHHTGPKNSHYCVLTNFLNPILDGLRLWDGLEWLVYALFGVPRRTDTSVAGKSSGVAGKPVSLGSILRKPAPIRPRATTRKRNRP